MLTFFLIYVVLIFLSAMFANGFYNITRGQWNIKPDGSKEWTGKIFSFWSKFLQQHTIKREYYIDKEWYKVLQVFIMYIDDQIIEIHPNGVVLKKMGVNEKAKFESFLVHNSLSFTSKGFGDSGQLYQFYKEVKVYKIPMWVSAPLGECITCLSSVIGTLCWIFWYQVIAQVQAVYPTEITGVFLTIPFIIKTGLWVFFCFSLAWVNEVVFFINNKLKN